MLSTNQKIYIGKMCADYSHKIDMFYHWLYGELKAYHKEDFSERERIAKEAGLIVPQLNI